MAESSIGCFSGCDQCGKIVLLYLPSYNASFHAGISIKSAQHFPRLVDTLGRRHGSLDSQATHVLPSLLQQRHKVVDSQHDVGDQLVLGHPDVSNSDTHAQHLLQLELDGRLDFVDLVAQVFVVRDWGREFTSCKM